MPGTEIEYYISIDSYDGDSISHPNFGWHTFTTTENILGDLNGDLTLNIIDIIIIVDIILNFLFKLIRHKPLKFSWPCLSSHFLMQIF